MSKLNKTSRKRVDSSLEAFNKYYSAGHGWDADRWTTTLFPALSAEVKQCGLLNPFVSFKPQTNSLKAIDLPKRRRYGARCEEEEQKLQTYVVKTNFTTDDNADGKTEGHKTAHGLPAPTLLPALSGSPLQLLSPYNLDASSLIPVLLLDPRRSESILDLCAAPGGKSIAIAQLLLNLRSPGSSAPGILHCNEHDKMRYNRLRRNLASYLPEHVLQHLRISSLDGSGSSFVSQIGPPPRAMLKSKMNSISGTGWDKILLDAPCSSERHVVLSHISASRSGRASDEMLSFRASPAGKKAITRLQRSLLLNALRLLREGGKMVYSTCSIDRVENECLVKSVLEKVAKGNEGFGVDVVEPNDLLAGLDSWSEERELGRICLPDYGDGGWGPLYFCVLSKTAAA